MNYAQILNRLKTVSKEVQDAVVKIEKTQQKIRAEIAYLRQEVLTLPQAAELLQMNPRILRRHTRAGIVPAKKIGGVWRYSRSQLLGWIRSSEEKPEDIK
jgi:hypothetical protein